MSQVAYAILPSNMGHSRVHPLPVSISNAIRNLLLTKVDKSPSPIASPSQLGSSSPNVQEITDGTKFNYYPPFDKIKQNGQSHTDTLSIRFPEGATGDQHCGMKNPTITFVTTNISETGSTGETGGPNYQINVTMNSMDVFGMDSYSALTLVLGGQIPLSVIYQNNCNLNMNIKPHRRLQGEYYLAFSFDLYNTT